LQTDPVGTKDDLNLSAYVANDPVNHVDPSGSQLQLVAALCTGPQAIACAIAAGVVTIGAVTCRKKLS